MSSYLDDCQTDFWRKVFKEEMKYILKNLDGCKKILSVGCGPAIIEKGLIEKDFEITGLDISKEAFEGAPDSIRKIVGSAEQMNIEDKSFDAVIYVASMQFIAEYKKAIKETSRILRPNGKIIVMLLNPESKHYKNWTKDPDSYMCKMKHLGTEEIENELSKYFSTESEYYLGIDDEKVFSSEVKNLASLYVIKGIKE